MAKTYRAYGRFDKMSRRVQFGDSRRSPAKSTNKYSANPYNVMNRSSNAGPVGPSYRPTPKKPAPKPTPRSGGGGGYGGGGYPSPRGTAINTRISANSSGNYTRPAAPPNEGPGPVPSINNFLAGDTGYQQSMRGFAQALSDFMADLTRRRGVLNTEFGTSSKALGDQKVQDLEGMEEDFGARGLLRSGLYAEEVGDYNTEWNQRMAELQRRQQEALGALTQEENQYKNSKKLKEQAAREEAIRRRAEQYGV